MTVLLTTGFVISYGQVIVDVLQGQFRSHLTCPDCKTQSRTFDPFSAVPLPLPPPPPNPKHQGGGGRKKKKGKKGRKNRGHRQHQVLPQPQKPIVARPKLDLKGCLKRSVWLNYLILSCHVVRVDAARSCCTGGLGGLGGLGCLAISASCGYQCPRLKYNTYMILLVSNQQP